MSDPHPDPNVLALGIRQPWVELIVRGIKTIEVRTHDTRVRGTIYLYASHTLAEDSPALAAATEHGLELDRLPRGVVVGTVNLIETSPGQAEHTAAACVPSSYLRNRFAWHLSGPCRLDEPLPIRFRPYGIWFYPWKRRRTAWRRRRGN